MKTRATRFHKTFTDDNKHIAVAQLSEGQIQIRSSGNVPDKISAHYHKKRSETIIVSKIHDERSLFGDNTLLKPTFKCWEVDEDGRRIGPVLIKYLNRWDILEIPPLTAHEFLLDIGSQIINLSPFYDESDKFECDLSNVSDNFPVHIYGAEEYFDLNLDEE